MLGFVLLLLLLFFFSDFFFLHVCLYFCLISCTSFPVFRERDDLMNMLTGQKAVLAEVRQREFEAYNQVKKSCNMVEQAQLEKAEVL